MLRRGPGLPSFSPAVVVLTASIGCASIAGLDADYVLGGPGSGGTATPTGTGGSGNSTPSGGTSAGGGPDGGIGGSAAAGGQPGCLGEGGLAPCADPNCAAAYECAPAVPSGFSGPYRVRSVSSEPAPTPEQCADGSSPALFFRGGGVAANCAACECDAGGVSCSLPTVTYFSELADCSGVSAVITPDGSCQAFGDICASCNRPRSMRIATPSQGQGSCAPSGGELQPSPMWQLANHLCASGADAGGCTDAGAVCVPTAAGAYGSPPCIIQAGAHQCPAAYPEAYTLFTGGTDTRGCSACGCGSPTCTAGAFTLYDAGGCVPGGESPLVIGPACSGDIRSWVDESVASFRAAAGSPQGCTPSGGAPIGGVAGEGETTLCCTAPLADP